MRSRNLRHSLIVIILSVTSLFLSSCSGNQPKENAKAIDTAYLQKITDKQALADEILTLVIKESEKVWQRKLDKPINLTVKSNGTEEERRYPMLWSGSRKGSSFNLILQDDFNLESTWWNMKPDSKETSDFFKNASLSQKYILVISHEVTHLYMAPAPMEPWFQEAAAMPIGKHIAVTIDPSINEAFPDPAQNIDAEKLFDYTYEDMEKAVDVCRELQFYSYSLTSSLKTEKIIDWVEGLRKNPDADNQQIYDNLPE